MLMTGLEQDTTYLYDLAGDSDFSYENEPHIFTNTFRTLPNPNDPVRIPITHI